MSRVRNRNTAAELRVRRALHAAGFRFRLHRRDLPGSPDVVLPSRRFAVFVHGCFWHGHSCRRGRRPATNQLFWDAKIERNLERDRSAMTELQVRGWVPFVIWECQIEDGIAELVERLRA